jgi:predicted phosphodiesterase
MEIYKLIVLSDLQIPYHCPKAVSALEQYLADERWNEWLQIGDLMDFDQVSRWNEGKPEALARSLSKDYAIGNAFLDRQQAIVRQRNPKAKFTVLAGNHCIRPEKFADANPQVRGLIEMEHGLQFEKRGIKYVKSYPKGELHKVGKAYFHHGLYTSANHAKKMAEAYGVNIFYGHTHDVQQYSKVLWGKNRTIVGQSLGCLCRYDLSYVGKNPTAWQQAFATFFIRPDGYFDYYITRIFNGSFVAPNGKVYTAK